MDYIAHKTEDGKEQTVLEHLMGTKEKAECFASVFGGSDYAGFIAALHDVGKYSLKFQEKIRKDLKTQVDHSTAGAQLAEKICKQGGRIASYCIAGHHGGLGDGGQKSDNKETSTLNGRLKKDIEDYSAFKNEMNPVDYLPGSSLPVKKLGDGGFTISFFIRMLFSCLKDADYLDTEEFVSGGKVKRGFGENVDVLESKLTEYLKRFENPKTEIHKKRTEILNCCLDKASLPQGLFKLTVPTGGGKTISSLAFAMRHLKEHKLRRIIYVIPYTSIIEQTAMEFRKIFGDENVLEHHSNYQYDHKTDEIDTKCLATENWDAPIVVTTNVQFFESIFSNRTSKCRKLHNIAASVIIFDETQMFPREYLKPSLRAIAELVYNYKCSAILCSATNPHMEDMFPSEIGITEISENIDDLYAFFKRNRIVQIGETDEDALAEQFNSMEQVLCIVNTKITAQNIFKKLEGEGNYHLSTLLYPKHRKQKLNEIRQRLKDGLPCRVIATSLIEAGVDVDFPTVYREKTGLDSQIQAAGRCNRENNNPSAESTVYVFSLDRKPPKYIQKELEAFEKVLKKSEDIDTPEAIDLYFKHLFFAQEKELDKKEITKDLEDGLKNGLSFPFEKVADNFRIIEDNTTSLLIPADDLAVSYADRIRNGERTRELMRVMGTYCVSVYDYQLEKLPANLYDGGIAILNFTEGYYSEDLGLMVDVSNADGIFL